jgi:hypothetical protein
MTKSRLTRRLTISSETLRVLQQTELSAAHGGSGGIGAVGSQGDGDAHYNTCGTCNTANCRLQG